MRIASAPTVVPPDPELVLLRLEGAVDSMVALEQRIHDATAAGAPVEQRWAGEVGTNATSLRFGANALNRLGSTNDVIMAQALLEHADTISVFASALRAAAAAGDHFGEAHSNWLTVLDGPIRDTTAAIDLLAGAPARP